jgi:hypothetical protein
LRERLPSRVRFPWRDSRLYFWSLMKRRSLPLRPGVFGLAHLVECLAEMAHDVKLVEQDRGLWRLILRDVAERLPHVP